MGYSVSSDIGSTNSGVIPVIGNRFTRDSHTDREIRTHLSDKHSDIRAHLSDQDSDILAHLSDEEATIASFGRKFSEMSERSRSLEEYRGDTLSDINSGLNMIASGIKVITTILSLFGADTVDR